MMFFARMTAVVAALLTTSVASASGHEIQWRAGMSRTVGFGHCAKGPCMRRATFSSNVPHRHVSGGRCEGRGAGGYTFGRQFPC